VTFGVVESEKPFLAELVALACESIGHDCLIFKDIAHVTRILPAIRVDTIMLDLERRGLSGLDWLEALAPSWPDLPSRALLLTNSELAADDVTRIKKLGAEVIPTPFSLVDVKHVVMERLQKARSDLTGGSRRHLKQENVVEL
jgi:DNA-binding response OmpR family regulator